jgi:Family of unknown function (DUF6338)
VFKRDCPKDHDAYVRVRLEGGVIYAGLVAHFTVDLEVDGKELVLAQPLASKTGDKPTMTALPAPYQRVVIRGSAIEVLAVEYRPKRQNNAAGAPPQAPAVTLRHDGSGSPGGPPSLRRPGRGQTGRR